MEEKGAIGVLFFFFRRRWKFYPGDQGEIFNLQVLINALSGMNQIHLLKEG